MDYLTATNPQDGVYAICLVELLNDSMYNIVNSLEKGLFKRKGVFDSGGELLTGHKPPQVTIAARTSLGSKCKSFLGPAR